jgi:prolyl oligopeptidase
MKYRIPVIAICAFAAVVVTASAVRAQPLSPPQAPRYPSAHRSGIIDDYGGVRVADPYRWLEDVTAAETRAWVDAENAVTASFIAQLPASSRQALRDRLTQFWKYPRLRPPFAGGDRLFYYENSGSDNAATLYVQDRPDVAPRVLLDPNALWPDGSTAVVAASASPDGKYLAYALSARGSEWWELRVRDVRSGQDVADTVRGVRHGRPAWTNDDRGFFYVRTGADTAWRMANPFAPVRGERVFYHHVGDRQADDQLIYERTDHPDWRLDVTVSEDGQYAVITTRRGLDPNNRVVFVDLDKPRRPNVGAPVVTLVDLPDARYEFVSSEGSIFYLLTTKDAMRGRVVGVDINAPHQSRWLTVVRETWDALVDARRAGDRIVAHRVHDSHSLVQLYALDGSARGEIHLPSVGTVTEITGRARDQEFYYGFTSYLVPQTIFRYDLETRSPASYKDARTDIDLSNYETRELFFTSVDGTRIPMSVSARRDIVLDGSHPTLLAVNGAFGQSFLPTFSPEIATWIDRGGVFAVANVRGGGEYGRAWHEAGRAGRKKTTVNDVIAAADFLIGQRYTRSAALAITGRAHGGLAAAAAVVQRPDLFSAVLIDGGVLDMARFDRFGAGWSWIGEYGAPSDPAQLAMLLSYSPLHAVREGTRYPATLITTSDRDGGVSPMHSYKMAAALQGAQPAGAPPVLLRVERNAGATAAIDAATDRLAFFALVLGLAR